MESTGYKDGSAILQALLKTSGQTIVFGRGEDKCSAAVLSSEVRVEVGATDHTSGSSEIATRNVTNYPWDQNYLTGSLVAVHCSGAYLAYAIKAPQKSSGMVRIMHRKSGDRGLVKNIRGMVRDLAFAHLNHRIILAFTDQFGTLYIWEVTPSDTEGQLNTEPILEVSSNSEDISDHHRVIWCPYIPDDQLDQSGAAEDDNDEPAWLLVLTHGQTAEIWNVSGVIRSNGGGVVTRGEVRSGYQVMEQHSGPITDAAFSPDGTALATASLDGTVKFFQVGQVYMADEERCPRCLHQWNPHDGKPLSALFFLDNHKHPSPDVQFWKYAVTGACNNSELRVWSCESWQCHQTLRFVPSQQDPPPQPLTLKAAMDPSAGFLLLSDIHRRVVYVVVVNQEAGSSVPSLSLEGINTNNIGSNSKNNNTTCGSARMVSVSELPVQYPSLFLAITDAAWKPYKRWKHDHGHDHAYNAHGDDMEDDGGSGVDMVQGVVMRWLLINTKSLQEATLRFQPQIPQALPSTAQCLLDLSSSQDSLVVRDGLTDLSMSFSASLSEVEADGGGLESQPPPPPPPDALTQGLTSPQMSMNLLTPDSFSSPRKPEECDNSDDVQENGSQVSQGSGDAPLAVSETCVSVTANGGRGTSATSSPSLEVQQILQDQNGKNNGIEDEGVEEEAELAEEDAAEDEEPEAHRHPQPIVQGPPPSQAHMHIPLSLAQTSHSIPSTLPSPPQPQNLMRGSLSQLPQVTQKSLVLTQPPTASLQASSSPLPLASPQPLPMTSPRSHSTPHDQRNNNTSLPHTSPSNMSSHSSHHTPLTSPHHPHLPLASPQPLPQGKLSLTSPQLPLTSPQLPLTSTQLPLTSTQLPLTSPQLPLTSPQLPLTSPQLPLTSPQLPLASPQLPLTSPQLPQTTVHLPHTSPKLPHTSPKLVPLSSVQQPPLDFIKSIATDNSITATQDVLKSLQRQTSTDITSQVLGGLNKMTCAQLEADFKGSAAASTNHIQDPRTGHTPASHSPGTTATIVSSSSISGQRRSVHESPGNILLNDLRSIVGSEIAPPSHHNGPIAQPATPGVTSEDIAELRSLLVSSMDLQRKQNTESVTASKLLSSKLDKAIQQMDQLAKQVQEMKQSQTSVQRELPRLIETTIRNEVRNTVTPGITKSLDPLRTQLATEVERIVKNTESQILDAVNRFIHSRSFVEVVSGSVGGAVAPAVQVSCREAYNKLVLPGFNSLTQQVFTQVNEAFSRGTREYLQNVESEMGVGRTAIQESVTKATSTLNLTCNSLASHSKSLQENITKLNQQHTSLCEAVSERVRCLVREEMGQCLQEHQANLDARSRAHTPAPLTQHTINPKVAQQQVQTLISQGQFNSAFKQALSASDLSLVVFVCERVNPQQVFNQTPCPLTQDVLLSLVNQLSHDLSTFTDLKMKYLEEAVMNLDVTHPVTREHMRSVLQGFQRNLQSYQHLNPTNKKVKMLVMAVTHLINS